MDRLSRWQYLAMMLTMIAGCVFLGAALHMPLIWIDAIVGLLAIPLCWQRLYDAGKPAWWALFSAIPIISIGIALMCLFLPSVESDD